MLVQDQNKYKSEEWSTQHLLAEEETETALETSETPQLTARQLAPDYKLCKPSSLNNTLYSKLEAWKPKLTSPILRCTQPKRKRNTSSKNAMHAQNRVVTNRLKFCIYMCLAVGWRRPWSLLWPMQAPPWTQRGGSVEEQQEAKERGRQAERIPVE